jgi:zinc protease
MLKAFYDTWYAPNNAILVVVGALDPDATLKKIESLFGDIPPKVLPLRPAVRLHPAKAMSFEVATDQPTGTQMLALRMPGLDSPDFPALEVLSDVLSSQRFALYGLVPEGKALSASFSLDPLPKAGIAFAEVSFPATADPKALADEVRSILGNVVKNGVPPELVEAAKVKERRETEFLKNSIEGLASVWSDAVALYGLKSPDEDLERIEKVTVDDVNRAARRYLNLGDAVSAVMIPRGSGRPTVAAGGFGGQENISLGEAHPTALPSWAESILTRISVQPSSLHPVVSRLANGLTLIVQPENVSDTVSVFGMIRNRPQLEAPADQQGVAQVLDPLFGYGSEHLDRLAFQRALEAIGAEEHAGTEFGVEVLADDFDRGVELLADNELHPGLPAAALKIIATQYSQVVAARNRSPGYLAQKSLRAALFPPQDPTLIEPTPATVLGLTPEVVRGYYEKVFRPDLTSIVVIGKITPEAARKTIDKYFGGWTAQGPAPETDLPAVTPNAPNTIDVPDGSRVQDTVVLAQTLGLARGDSDYYALQLGSAVLGGGFYSTRLSIELRKNAGLVYSVDSSLQAGRTRSVYMIDYACDPGNVSKAANIVQQELRRMQTAPATADELLRVKALLVRRLPLAEASIDGIATGLLSRWDLGLPLDEPSIAARRYLELSANEVQAAFQKWIRPNDLVRMTQGPAPQ